MTVSLVTPPLVEPVSLAEIKAFLKIDQDHDDDMLRAFISAARVHLEHLTARLFISQSWRVLLTGPLGERFTLPLRPVTAISAAAILNGEGDVTDLAEESFSLFQEDNPAMVSNLGGIVLTSSQRLQLDVEAGHGPAAEDVPEPIRHAIKLVVGEWYERRLIADPDRLPSLAAALQPLLAPYRSIRL